MHVYCLVFNENGFSGNGFLGKKKNKKKKKEEKEAFEVSSDNIYR